jgi:hypothetical protein
MIPKNPLLPRGFSILGNNPQASILTYCSDTVFDPAPRQPCKFDVAAQHRCGFGLSFAARSSVLRVAPAHAPGNWKA